MLRKLEALNIAKAEPTGDIYSRVTRQRKGGMDNVGDFIASVSLGYHGLAFHLTALALPAQSSYIWHGDFLMSVRIFFAFRRMVDGRRSAVHELL